MNQQDDLKERVKKLINELPELDQKILKKVLEIEKAHLNFPNTESQSELLRLIKQEVK